LKVLKGDAVGKRFTVDKNTTSITVTFDLFNQWYAAGGPCDRIVSVTNVTKSTQVRRHEMPTVNQQIYPTHWKFNIACDQGDLVDVYFESPDPGRDSQKVRVRNVVVDTSGTGD
jgi:acyl-CoA hydrolase